MCKRKRLTPDERLEQILEVAISLAEETHFHTLKHVDIATRANCSPGLVKHYLGIAPVMRLRVLQAACKAGSERVIKQGQRFDLVTPAGNLKRSTREMIAHG